MGELQTFLMLKQVVLVLCTVLNATVYCVMLLAI